MARKEVTPKPMPTTTTAGHEPGMPTAWDFFGRQNQRISPMPVNPGKPPSDGDNDRDDR
jgi:hypothetical protein